VKTKVVLSPVRFRFQRRQRSFVGRNCKGTFSTESASNGHSCADVYEDLAIQSAGTDCGQQCGFHAIRPPSPGLSGRVFHAHPATHSTVIRPGSRSAATQGWHC
jgi:hypothetical protein